MLPLQGLTVLDMGLFLAGPVAALRLADLGAQVIKIERSATGDLCRQLYISNLKLDGDSTLFHSINRNKQSFSANLKAPADLQKVRHLVQSADVLIQNFRPGVVERLGLDYVSVQKLNPRLVYGAVSGYGDQGSWRGLPGQDLLAHARSGLVWLTGGDEAGPMPMGLAVADMFAGADLVQGILACLVRRGITGLGGRVDVSLMEALLDFQFEVLTTHLNDGGQLPQRSRANPAHAYLAAPYGIYATADGHLAIAMTPVPRLGELLQLAELAAYGDPQSWFSHRDQIKQAIARLLQTKPTRHWLDIREPADIWCAQVLNWTHLLAHEGFQVLDMVQQVSRPGAAPLKTLRCPIRIDGQVLKSPLGAPRIGQDNAAVTQQFGLADSPPAPCAQPALAPSMIPVLGSQHDSAT